MKQIQDMYPLSPLQQGMLFHSVLAPEAGMHLIQVRHLLRGPVDAGLLEQAWQTVLERHSALRTAFIWQDLDEPVQVVYRRVALPIRRHDWRQLPAAAQAQQLQQFLDEDRRQGFDLASPPLMRLALIRLADQTHQFIWSCHHLLVDGWTLNLVLGEVFLIYNALEQGQAATLPPARPYRDYIAWFKRQDLAAAERFWRDTLRGFPAPTQLRAGAPPRRDPPALDDHALVVQHLSQPLTGRLQALAQAHSLTLNTLFQGAWALLLSRYSGEADVVFGATVAGRPAELPGVERMVGLFINTLPVRVQVQPDAPVIDWLQQLQQQQLEARQYDYSPLVQVQRWSELPAGVPLFESLLVFENFMLDSTAAEQAAEIDIDAGDLFDYTNYPLDLEIIPGPELTLRLLYDRQRYDDATAARILAHLGAIVGSFVERPTQPLQAVSMLSAAERTQILDDLNGPATAYPDGPQVVQALFEAAVQRHPDKLALVFQEHRLSFGQLNAIANQLSACLIERGAGPGSFVGLFVERSHHAVIGALACFKAGAAYVPLDPSYPRERLQAMIEDAQPPLMLTQSWLRGQVPSAFQGQLIAIDTADLAAYPAENAELRCEPHDLAYLIYTSGTTGRPKGVLIQHDTYWKTCHNYVRGYQLDRFDPIALNLGSISFDVFNGDLARSVLTGAPLVICPDDARLDPDLLYQLIARERVNLFESTPVLINAFLEDVIRRGRDLSWLKVLISSADAWRTLDYRALRDRLDLRIRLINAYGITEATIDSTFYEETAQRHPELPFVSIGKPFDNIRIYVLDQQQQPVPQGFVGELYIGGPCLARGYLHDAALTEARFLPDPFVAGGRMYKTGDLARWLPDGNLEFLGRADYQVKLRGFRIELSEVETVLRGHPAVRDVVVLIREDSPGEKQLVAYVVAKEPGTENREPDDTADGSRVVNGAPVLGAHELRQFLSARLPDYMVPAAFVALPALPLSSNGKIDRQALPSPDRSLVTADSTPTLPQTPEQQTIAAVWEDVLRRAPIGLDDNFFALGGHSLLVMRMISRLREAFQVDLPVRLLFDEPTVRGLAAAIMRLRDGRARPHWPPISAVPRDGVLPLSFAQQRLWLSDQLDPNSAAHNISNALRISGELDQASLARAFEQLARRHETLRTSIGVSDGQPFQQIAPPMRFTLPLTDLRALPADQREAEARRLATAEFQQPFVLALSPLWRARLLWLDQRVYVLLITIHHIVADEWSINVLMQELITLYLADLQQRPPELPALPVQYADYAAWQQATLSDGAIDRQLAYWRQQLSGELPTLTLPGAQPPAAERSDRGASQVLTLSVAQMQRLQQLGQQHDATLFMTMLAAFQVLLSRVTEQTDLIVGTDVVSRSQIETERLIGLFINQLAIRVQLAGNPTFAALLRQVREATLGAYANQDVPFERVVKEVQPRRERNRSPLFQIKLVFINRPQTELPTELPGLSFAPFETTKGTANFDLVLFVEERPDRLLLDWTYRTDVFEPALIARLAEQFQVLLDAIVAQPDQRIKHLAIQPESERKQRTMDHKKSPQLNLNRFKTVKPRAVDLSEQELVRMTALTPGQTLPLVIQPSMAHVDLAQWAGSSRELIEARLAEHGAILFRDFQINDEAAFERFARELYSDLFKENGEHTPVTDTGIQTPVFYPPDKQLLWHNENSFNYQWPMKILFCCATPASQGGETPIVDSRQVFQLLDPAIRDEFMRKQVMYMRNYGDGLGLDWQTVFRTTDKAAVEAYCRQNQIAFEWKAGDRLRTRQVRPAVIRHPITGELSWFNQAQHWHIACVDPETRASLRELFREEDLPRHCYYGDGSPIDDQVMQAILEVYRRLDTSFAWHAGDVMLIDNTLAAHGRNPFVGQRKILVALAQMRSYADLPALGV